MSSSAKNERRLTGYKSDTINNTNVGQIQHHSLYEDDTDDYQQYNSMGDDDDTYEEYDEELDDVCNDERDETGSELSIPDANIDFDLVYALHTFAATVEGQASVVRGDALTLLDDSNSYWWLVKVLKSAEVGYIPAENIETPHERLARLNSHRNIELTKRDIQDNFPIPPSNKSKKKRVTLAKGVQFQSQIVYGSSDDESDYEAEFEHWNERMRSDDSENESDDDPYQYYEETQDAYFTDSQTVDAYASSFTQNQSQTDQVAFDMHHPHQNKSASVPHHYNEDGSIDYHNEEHMSGDSDIINDAELQMMCNGNRDTLDLENETIKISLTPSVARGYEDRRSSDGSVQTKSKKAAKLEKLLGGSSPSPEPEAQRKSSKDKKSSIRKFFSRKESKKSKKNGTLERRPSNESSANESISSQSFERERTGSVDSTIQPTKIKVFPGKASDFGEVGYKYAMTYPSTTALEVIQQLVQLEQDDHQLMDDNAYQDHHMVIKTLNGDEFTLGPSDKPLEIFHSLTAHLNTPMPSLKKARRISQLMASESTRIGGPKGSQQITSEDEVQFYLFSKTRRVEEGEIQIKVSLFANDERVDKLVKVASSMVVRDVTSLLLEKFHILNGVVAGSDTNDAKSLRLDGDHDIVRYGLIVNDCGQERLLDLDEELLCVFGDNAPTIHYKRNSNPDRSSITMNISPPDQSEIYFILKRMEAPRNDQPIQQSAQDCPNSDVDTEEHAENTPKPKLVRHDTPMPEQETTATHDFEASIDQMPPQINTAREIGDSSEKAIYESKLAMPPLSPSSPDDIDETMDNLDQDQAEDDLVPQSPVRPQSIEPMLFAKDFGMNDLMALIRGAAESEKTNSHGRHTSFTIRSEISDVFKESQARLDQLEKELDRIMNESLKIYH